MSNLYIAKNCVFCSYTTADFFFNHWTVYIDKYWSQGFKSRAVIILYLVPLSSYLKAQKTKFFQNYPKKQSNCMVFIKNIFTIILECITMILCIIWLATQKLMLQNTKLTMKSLTTGDFQTLKSVHNKKQLFKGQ